MNTISTREPCSNPFRIPHHIVLSNLRIVPQTVRERLPHVSFGHGHKVCASCRQRVYTMLKERRHLKPSLRLEGNSRRSDVSPKPNRSEANVTTCVAQSINLIEVPLINETTIDNDATISNLQVTDSISRLTENTMSRRNKPQLQQNSNSSLDQLVCCFCGLTEDNEVEFGKFYQHSGIVTHYYCLLLSSNMEQKGNDDEGILGFLADDIVKEIRRGKRLVCSYCKKNGATLGCCNTKCKRIFHFPCGLKAGSLHQFFGEFRSYCINHRPRQKIDERLKKEIQTMSNILCYICYEDVKPLDSTGTMWAPCCKKNAWFHRKCVQQLAMSAGYFFKCPLCNNKREFQTAMLEYGIYIPRQDASWELVPNAFEELLYRHDRCDAKTCLCPKGRKYTSNNAKWELALCRMCGSQGTHLFCGQLKWANPVWECQECITIIKKPGNNLITTDDSMSNSIGSSRRDSSTINLTIRECEDDSDSDISVGNESVPLESNLNNIPSPLSQIKLRPGPRSFKLQQVEKIKSTQIIHGCTNLNDSSSDSIKNIDNNIPLSILHSKICSTSTKVPSDVICLDSDDEAVEIVCETKMKRSITNNRRFLFNNFNNACSSNSSSNSTNSSVSMSEAAIKSSIKISSSNEIVLMNENNSNMVPSTTIEDNQDFACNLVISNVVSVPPEFFASVPEPTEAEHQMIEIPNNLKRTHPSDENDNQFDGDGTKRARFEETNQQLNYSESDNVKRSSTKMRIESLTTNMPNFESFPINALAGSSGASSSVENSYSWGSNSATGMQAPDLQWFPPANAPASLTSQTTEQRPHSTNYPNQNQLLLAPIPIPESIPTQTCDYTVLENGPTSYCSSSGSSGRSSESRYVASDRSGLIPKFIGFSQLKFKICGERVELALGACKLNLKVNGLQDSTKLLNDAGNIVSTSVSPFTGSNQNTSSEKSSKSSSLRSGDLEEFDKQTKLQRVRNPKTFVYEDDNTLLEYPTSATDSKSNVKITRKSLLPLNKSINTNLDRNDLKENWDPVVSSSCSTHDNSDPTFNRVNSLDIKENNNLSFREKLTKSDEHEFLQSSKDDSSTNQRFLRRSNRIIRHFRSVQNDQINGDCTDSNANNEISTSFGKTNLKTINDHSEKSSRSLKPINNIDIIEKDKHLKNVYINDLKLAHMEKVNGTYDKNIVETEANLMISIDLQRLSNLINAKPELFFNTKNNGVKRLESYRLNDKLKVEFKSGETKFLIKAQSFDCLLDITKDNTTFHLARSKSLDNLSYDNSNDILSLTNKKDCKERKIRRSQRRKSRPFEKHECVR